MGSMLFHICHNVSPLATSMKRSLTDGSLEPVRLHRLRVASTGEGIINADIVEWLLKCHCHFVQYG